ncbi:hypothetical protein LXJ15735_03060 [Lacrimispora xylanolytica]
MIIKALNSLQEEFGDDIDDFFFSYQVFIGPEEVDGACEVYDFNLISIKRLARDFSDFGIMLNRGWMISKYFDEEQIKREIEYIIKKSINKDNEISYNNIAMFLRREEQ